MKTQHPLVVQLLRIKFSLTPREFPSLYLTLKNFFFSDHFLTCGDFVKVDIFKTLFKESCMDYCSSKPIRCRVQALRADTLTVAGLAQSVERLTAERVVAGSIPGAGPLLRVLK